MFTFLLVVQTIVAVALVSVILMQRSEGGGLGVGGSSSGLMSARGASDFLTRFTAILGGLFVILSITLAAVAGVSREAATVDTSLVNQVAPVAPPADDAPPLVAPGPGQPSEDAPAQNEPQNESGPAVPFAQ